MFARNDMARVSLRGTCDEAIYIQRGRQTPLHSYKLPPMILLIIASAAFGLSIGLYDLLMPLFLDHAGISYGNMGVIFSFSAIFLFFIRIYAGHISDIIGRKHVFSLSLLFCSIANLFTPFSIHIVPQMVFKVF